MNLRTIDAIIEDQKSAAAYIKERINYCYNRMVAEINTELYSCFQQATVLENNLVGTYRESMASQAAQPGTRAGIILQLRQNSFTEIILSKVSLWTTNYTGPVTIKVHNMVSGQELDSFEINVIANQIQYFDINKKYMTNKQYELIYISYLTDGIDSIQSTLFSTYTGCSTCSKGSMGSRYMIMNGATIGNSEPKLYSNLQYPGTTAGLSIQYSLNCSTDSFLCSLKDQLAWPLLHLLGADLCQEIINGNKRLNSVTTVLKDQAEALKPDFEAKYMDSIQSMFQRMQLPEDVCIKRNRKVRTVSRIP